MFRRCMCLFVFVFDRWFDAGDYSKYVLNTCPTVWRMLNGYEMFPHKFNSDDWNIPESGNNVSDYLDEVQWELAWLEKMQASDGGVYDKTASEMWEENRPDISNLGGSFAYRYILPRSTAVTAVAGAVFAQAARIWADINGTTSSRYLERALLAFEFLEKHPTDLPVGGFTNPPGHVSGPYYDSEDADNRCWLAGELFRTTCEPAYALMFEELFDDNQCSLGWNDFQHFGLRAQWSYYHSTCTYDYADYKTDILNNNFKHFFASLLLQAEGNQYRSIARQNVFSWINFGAFAQVVFAQDLLLGSYIYPKSKHLYDAAMVGQVDVSLGANPQAMSYVTGLGKRRPMHPLHWSRFVESDEPTPGIGVFGPAAHMPNTNSFYEAVQSDDNNFPSRVDEDSPFPVYRRYTDDILLVQNSEFGINTMGAQCSVLMYLKNASFEKESYEVATNNENITTTTCFEITTGYSH
jgi:hypothetical protein